MHARRLAVTILMLVIMLAILSPVAGQTFIASKDGNNPGLMPWKVQIFDNDTDATSLSSGFGGPKQIPFFSYAGDGYPINLAVPIDSTSTECGPNNQWTCWNYGPSNNRPGTFSPIATHTIISTFYTGWVYQRTDDDLYLIFSEWNQDF